jgi:hypothetical protein
VRAYTALYLTPQTCEDLEPLLEEVFVLMRGKNWALYDWGSYPDERFLRGYWVDAAGGLHPFEVVRHPPF